MSGRDPWDEVFEAALPEDAPGAWIRRAITAQRESGREPRRSDRREPSLGSGDADADGDG